MKKFKHNQPEYTTVAKTLSIELSNVYNIYTCTILFWCLGNFWEDHG